MHDAVRVRVIERISDLFHELERFVEAQAPTLTELHFESVAIDELHDEERARCGMDDVMNSYDAGMVELGRHLCFARGAPTHLVGKRSILELIEADLFDCDMAVEHRVDSAIDDAMGPSAELCDDLVAIAVGLGESAMKLFGSG